MIGRLSPSVKKRNIKGQMSSQMNKTTSMNEVKKIIQKNVTSSSSLKTKNFYKTMIKPQSFVGAIDQHPS